MKHAHESLNRIALSATVHCLTGCAIGEVAGMVIGNALGWSNAATIAASVALAFVAGFTLTAIPFLRRGDGFLAAARIAVAADTASIALMELVGPIAVQWGLRLAGEHHPETPVKEAAKR